MALSFETPPEVSLLTIFLKGGKGLRDGETIPRIEASANRLVGTADAYAKVCGSVEEVPICWPAVLARSLQLAVMTAPAFPFKLAGIVHTRQQIRRLRAIGRDETLSARCWVEGHRVVRSGGEFDLHTEVSSGGEVVWTGVTTILTKAVKGDGEKRPRPAEVPFRATRSVCWRLPGDLGRRYAAVSGDYNPIHLSPWTSRPFGFRRPIVHGWWSLARMLAELDTDLPAACTVEASFIKPVPLPGSVTFEAGPSADGLRFALSRGEPCVVGVVREG